MNKKEFIEELRNMKKECGKHRNCKDCPYCNGWNDAEQCIIACEGIPFDWEILGWECEENE